MKSRFDFLVLTLFISSLMALTFSHHELVFTIAFIISLISLALWLADDWINLLFMRITDVWLALSAHHFVATAASTRTNSGHRFLLKRGYHPLRAHQRWRKARTGRGIRHELRHRSAF